MLGSVILAAGFVIVLGLVLGLVIGLAARAFAVPSDPRVERVSELLPGANCGGCGRAGCADFAKAIVNDGADPGGCPVLAAAQAAEIAALMGTTAGEKKSMKALVLCGGANSRAKSDPNYNGVNDCASAVLVAGGPKKCQSGCLGLGTCSRICPFNAIEITEGLAVVHPRLCVGCGKCVAACPRGIIKMVPEAAKAHVFCSSPAKGPAKKKVCEVSCIGCRKCAKAAAEGQINMDGFLARVNYDNPPAIEVIAAAGCPTGCLGAAVELGAFLADTIIDTSMKG